MNALFSFLLLFMAIIYWVFRVIVCLMSTMQLDFFTQPYNADFEIIMLFVIVFCIVLVIKRNIIGPTIYFGVSLAYFGSSLYEKLMATGEFTLIGGSEILLEAIGLIIPLLMFLDILTNKNKMNFAEARKTEWYFGTDKYDRQYDERADKNQYKM